MYNCLCTLVEIVISVSILKNILTDTLLMNGAQHNELRK